MSNPAAPPFPPTANLNPNLPISQLESLKFKANQIMEAIVALERTVSPEYNQAMMPPFPEILSKYSMLVSQCHSFSNSLVAPIQQQSASNSGSNPYGNITVHPSVGMSDAQLDELLVLLRHQQTNDVLALENATVRRLSEAMTSRGSLGVLAPTTSRGTERKTEYDDVLRECEKIAQEHDGRVKRALDVVTTLKDGYGWYERVEVEEPEPEELSWDPIGANRDIATAGDEDEDSSDSDSDEEEEDGGENQDGATPSDSQAGAGLFSATGSAIPSPMDSLTAGLFSAVGTPAPGTPSAMVQ